MVWQCGMEVELLAITSRMNSGNSIMNRINASFGKVRVSMSSLSPKRKLGVLILLGMFGLILTDSDKLPEADFSIELTDEFGEGADGLGEIDALLDSFQQEPSVEPISEFNVAARTSEVPSDSSASPQQQMEAPFLLTLPEPVDETSRLNVTGVSYARNGAEPSSSFEPGSVGEPQATSVSGVATKSKKSDVSSGDVRIRLTGTIYPNH